MKKVNIISALFAALLGVTSCIKEPVFSGEFAPEGSPVTMYLNFGADGPTDVLVGTKYESNRVDESNVHDLYVMIFDENENRIYGRFFTYEHLISNITTLNNQENEGWYVKNKDIDNTNSVDQTRGIVKISTISASNCTLVVLANLTSTVFSLDGKDAADRLSSITTLDELKAVKIVLKQNTVDRGNQFLRLGIRAGINTGDLSWGTLGSGNTPNYNEAPGQAPPNNSQIVLAPLDAKIKFRIKHDPRFISEVTPRYWQACRIPESGLLYPNETDRDEQVLFDAQQAYFEGTEVEPDPDDPDNPAKYTIYNVFCFYMLENRQTPLRSVTTYNGREYDSKYYLRELQEKLPDTNPDHPAGSVVNGNWVYARQDASYVKFSLILGLTYAGIQNLDEEQANMTDALTSEAVFTVHLGDFTNSATGSDAQFDDYNVHRGYNYVYDITIHNSRSVYVEVRGEKVGSQRVITENEPGQEGSLLLTTSGIINCDAHYEYKSIDFVYDDELGADNDNNPLDKWPMRSKISWFVKTPFYNSGPVFNEDTGFYEMLDPAVPGNEDLYPDYQWILFALNNKKNGKYVVDRRSFPGIDDGDRRNYYQPNWTPDPAHPDDVPELMDINQLINFIFLQDNLEYRRRNGEAVTSKFVLDDDGKYRIRLTAFVNEYYYETDPRTYTKSATPPYAPDPNSGELNTNLWREFVNASPRELHILSNTQVSKDRRSDVIISSYAIIQQSIQTIYNIFAPDLTSLWGLEHKDEMSAKSRSRIDFEKIGWPWWGGTAPSGQVLYNDDENGRLNSAGLWGITSSSSQRWNDFLEIEVDNDTPELKETRYYQAYSCLTRNRDNNGNGYIDPEELRWYTASVNQLVGMWVGNEALSVKARLYQPVDKYNTTSSERWRSEVISSTLGLKNGSPDMANPRILRAEEGATKSDYTKTFGDLTTTVRDKVASVRCLRNIGTYNDHGTQREITEAPFDYMVDQYFDFKAGQDKDGKAWPNDDGTYTINFTRLNMKSIRPYTDGDLPYHEEYSTNNMVYLRFTAQAPSEAIITDGSMNTTQKPFNDAVSVHNTYCPPGYRVPNMTELLMMSALLPESYWHRDGDMSNALPGSPVLPCRTYFSRGKYGSLPTPSENAKVGWGYNPQSRQVLLPAENQRLNLIRCIKDENMIGDITGRISVTDNENLRWDSPMEIELNFSSMTSVIRNVTLKLCYTDASGDKKEKEISSEGLQLNSTSLRQTIQRVLPESINVDGFMTVRAIVRNAAGIERTFETPIRIVPQTYASISLLPNEYKGWVRKTIPILITASHSGASVAHWTLLVTTPDKRVSSINIDDLMNGSTYNSIIIPYYPGWDGSTKYWQASERDWDVGISDNPAFKTLDQTLMPGTYTFQLEAECNYYITRSEQVSMDVLKVDYDPMQEFFATRDTAVTALNPNPYVASDIASYVWKRIMVEGLDFAAGDFIETDMDVNRCRRIPVYYKKAIDYTLTEESFASGEYFRKEDDQYYAVDWAYVSSHPSETYYVTALDNTASPGLDELISFGYSDITWSDWLLSLQFPAVNAENEEKRMLDFVLAWDVATNGYKGINYADFDKQYPLTVRLDKDGIYYNGNLVDLNQWPEAMQGNAREVLNRLTGAKTLYIGSADPYNHRSRAVYRYVRVVHNGQYSSTSNSNTDFKNDPEFGGNL